MILAISLGLNLISVVILVWIGFIIRDIVHELRTGNELRQQEMKFNAKKASKK